MSLVSQSVKNLKGGISQQPDILRYPEQGARQINGWSSEVEGLQKRPPMTHVKVLGPAGSIGVNPLVHLINRDEQEQYYAVFTGTNIKVFDMNGKEYAVRYPNGADYITTPNPRDDLKMVTVADYTFITNRTKVVREGGTYSWNNQYRPKGQGLINVRGGQYGRTLQILVNGQLSASLVLPSGTGTNQAELDAALTKMDAQWIAAELARQLQENLAPSGWSFNVGQGFIQIIAPAGVNLDTLQTRDGYADQLINPVTAYAQSFSKLPLNAPNGFVVKIVGDSTKTADQYYVQYDEGQRVWKEVLGWNVKLGLNSLTMPWALVRASDGNFDLKPLSWSDRAAGDDDTNPMPSFVDSTINDIFFFRNRLGFLSGENIVLSRTAKYFNFFPASVANLSDDDPIDVAVSHNRVSILKHAVPFSEELLLWSDQAQFVLGASGTLSSTSVELSLTTQFDVQDHARPFGIGRNVYFTSPRATFSSIMRYYAVQDVSNVKNAEDMSAHVPSYIPNGVYSIAGSSTENFATVLTTGDQSKIFIYKFLYLNEELRQQSWSHWDFGDNVRVRACNCIGSIMHIIWENGYAVFMSRVSFTKHTLDYPDEPYRSYLDQKLRYVIPAGSYNDDTYTTAIDLSEAYNGGIFQRGRITVMTADGHITTFEQPEGGWVSNDRLHLNGNMEGQVVFIGFNIPFLYEFSKFLIKQTADDGTVATEDIGRLQLRRAWVNYEESGSFDIAVTNVSRTFTYVMSGARLGSARLQIGALNVGTGQFRFPIPGNAKNSTVVMTSDNPTPLNIIGCGWEGNYVRRSAGI